MLPREPYLPAAGEDAARWMTVTYKDGGLTRSEVLSQSGESDAYFGWRQRISRDNGRTWCEPRALDATH